MSGQAEAKPGSGGAEDLYVRLFGWPPDRRRLSVIWATVDRDRVIADLDLAATVLSDDPHLGASVALLEPDDGEPIALVEPAREGRLAATLARLGEGPVGEYVEAPLDLDVIRQAAAAVGLVATGPADGPFGRSVLVATTTLGGPSLVLVERPAGTIGR